MMLEQLETLEQTGLAELAAANDAAAIEQWRIQYLGSKGKVKAALGAMKDVPGPDKPAYGKRVNELKKSLDSAFKARGSNAGPATGPAVDLTEPGLINTAELGQRHIITRVRAELVEVFARMGFEVAEGPELEDDDHNFIKLNMPMEHPARDPIDNFYVDDPATSARPRMLRSQTSTVQIRVMETREPPIKIIAPGRVYRPDTVDATHSFMFHQIEGLYIDRGVTMADLRTCLLHFAQAYFDADADVRLRPSYFPFTEPSAEFDMKIALNPDKPAEWIELGGCGMVDPNVLSACGIDPEEWSGFAFGFGMERLAMGKYGIPDIRMLFENDLRFLRQI